jgi:hypothetical protein
MKRTMVTLLLHRLTLFLYGMAHSILHDRLPTWPTMPATPLREWTPLLAIFDELILTSGFEVAIQQL